MVGEAGTREDGGATNSRAIYEVTWFAGPIKLHFCRGQDVTTSLFVNFITTLYLWPDKIRKLSFINHHLVTPGSWILGVALHFTQDTHLHRVHDLSNKSASQIHRAWVRPEAIGAILGPIRTEWVCCNDISKRLNDKKHLAFQNSNNTYHNTIFIVQCSCIDSHTLESSPALWASSPKSSVWRGDAFFQGVREPRTQRTAERMTWNASYVRIHATVAEYCSICLLDSSSASRFTKFWHSAPMPPFVPITSGVKVPCSTVHCTLSSWL